MAPLLQGQATKSRAPRMTSEPCPVAACVVIVAVLLGPACGGRGELAALAARAKAEGRSETTVSYIYDSRSTDMGLSAATESLAVLLVSTKVPAAATTASNGQVFTWDRLEVIRTLKNGLEGPVKCERVPHELGDGEVWLSQAGGTVTVDGVRVTMLSNVRAARLTAGSPYLLLAKPCGPNSFYLPDGSADVFRVGPDGRLSGDPDNPSPPFVAELLAVGDVDSLAVQFEGVSRPR